MTLCNLQQTRGNAGFVLSRVTVTQAVGFERETGSNKKRAKKHHFEELFA
jgi:hypothetical protein